VLLISLLICKDAAESSFTDLGMLRRSKSSTPPEGEIIPAPTRKGGVTGRGRYLYSLELERLCADFNLAVHSALGTAKKKQVAFYIILSKQVTLYFLLRTI